ncbi:MAG: hypothetical protein ABIQ88_23480 [Chitinophagaceae bacterium]
MKIRIKGNALRYRLTRSDIDLLEAKGIVHEQSNFGTALLQYELRSTDVDQLSASFINNCITIRFPAAWIAEWLRTDKVGYEHRMELEGGGTLHLLVEKDFTCLDKVNEDQSDHYPNPLIKK